MHDIEIDNISYCVLTISILTVSDSSLNIHDTVNFARFLRLVVPVSGVVPCVGDSDWVKVFANGRCALCSIETHAIW